METETFIIAAYALTGALLTLLCLSTWIRARNIASQLNRKGTP